VHEAGETLTQTGLIVGTPAYMSPEQAGATGHAVDGRSDIYSLGCVLYEMLAGERPFAGATPQAMIAQRLMGAPPDPRLARPAVPEVVAVVVTRSLATDPEDRFATAGDLVAALRSAALSRMPETTPGAAATTGGPRRHRGRAAVAAALLLAAVGAAWLASRAPAHAALEETLLAVAPFDVLEPSLALWHEGLMDVFSRTLDGAGPLRTVSPAVIVRRWGGRADHVSAMELAHATRAARVLYGAMIPAGPDSLRLTASLLDARQERATAEFDLHGPRDRVDQLADSLTLAVLRALAPPTGLAPAAGSPVGTASSPALKAFLEGEQHFRRSEFDQAKPAFAKAVALDSGFGVAWHRLSQSTLWRDSSETYSTQDPQIYSAAFRAAAARGLSLRDSLVLTADSVFWACSSRRTHDSTSGSGAITRGCSPRSRKPGGGSRTTPRWCLPPPRPAGSGAALSAGRSRRRSGSTIELSHSTQGLRPPTRTPPSLRSPWGIRFER
jgi:eukaryotic-like serine/threonine-protein kinase